MQATPFRTARWILAIGLATTLLVQLYAVQGTWFLDSDDWLLIRMGREVVEQPTLHQFTRFWTEEPTWRPALTARTAIESLCFGDAITPRILLNITLHLGAALLLFAIVHSFFGSTVMAAWASVLYAAHPLHAESITWFHSGFEGMTVTVLVLLTCWAFVSQRALWIGLLAFQAALLTRENALCVPLILLIIAAHQCTEEGRIRSALRKTAPYWGLLAINVIARTVAVLSASEQAPLGNFHFTEHPAAALLTTFAHPWLPIHPALDHRNIWWLPFLALLPLLLWLQRKRSRQALHAAIGLFAVLSLPFLPQFHDATRFLEVLPGGHEQRWYYFHLPLTALMIWPAFLLAEWGKEKPRAALATGSLILSLFLMAQYANGAWWHQRAQTSRYVAAIVADTLQERPRAVGLVLRAGTDEAELADQIFLNMQIIWPDSAQRGVPAFHLRQEGESTRVEKVVVDERGQPHWEETTKLAPKTVWLRWSDEAGGLVPIKPRDLPLPPHVSLPSCCAGH